MARKGLLIIPEEELTAVNSTQSEPPPAKAKMSYGRSGAFGAVTREIDNLTARADAAREIEARLTAGEIIVELDPAEIDSSFIVDRLARDGQDLDDLVEAIRTRGQDSPILVRQHPASPGRYQVAFGHRRVRAAQVLGRKVRAVVKQLTDRDLVLAQGQENSARANLSFVERALFASRLEEKGHDRETIMSALAVDKTVVSRMISVARKLPVSLVEAIGPAPNTGRDRWVELATAYGPTEVARDIDLLLQSDQFKNAESDARFELIAALLIAPTDAASRETGHLPKPSTAANGSYWSTAEGRRIARVKADRRKFTVAIDEREAPGFGDYLLSQMDRLYASYAAERKEAPAEQ